MASKSDKDKKVTGKTNPAADRDSSKKASSKAKKSQEEDETDEDELDDSGCTITGAIESLEESGVCLESIWPYYVKRVNKCPNDAAYSAAENNTISDALQLKIDLHEMKSCLAQGFPFVFGLELYKSFDKAAKKGIVPMPRSGEVSRESHGR